VRVPGLVSTVLSAMPQEYERGLGSWHAEWETLPELLRLTGGALHHLAEMMPSLEVNEHRIRENLERTRGLIFAEAVSMALAERMGKMAAHQLLENASQKTRKEKRHLVDVLRDEAELHGHLTPTDLENLFDVKKYLGSAEQFVEQVVARAKTFPSGS
jgi:3-carboxy-cis,cis-muconate cycloisomerase